MGFSIEISEVGPAEYPLLQTLRDTVFAEFGHVSKSSIEAQFAGRQRLVTLIAHLEGNPVGFCAGYERTVGVYFINYLALLPDYRRQGIGRRLIERLEALARMGNDRQIQFNSYNHFSGMIRLGLSMGYLPFGIEQHAGSGWDLSIRFNKLLRPDPAPVKIDRNAEIVRDQLHIPGDDATALRAHLDEGYRFHGMIHESGRAFPTIVLGR